MLVEGKQREGERESIKETHLPRLAVLLQQPVAAVEGIDGGGVETVLPQPGHDSHERVLHAVLAARRQVPVVEVVVEVVVVVVVVVLVEAGKQREKREGERERERERERDRKTRTCLSAGPGR